MLTGNRNAVGLRILAKPAALLQLRPNPATPNAPLPVAPGFPRTGAVGHGGRPASLSLALALALDHVAVVGGIAEDLPGLERCKQSRSLWSVSALPGRQQRP